MNKLSKGNVVKFTDAKGLCNGGTVTRVMHENNVDYALVNTLDGHEIRMRSSELSVVDRKQRGRVPAQFFVDLKEEIMEENAQLTCATAEHIPMGYKASDETINADKPIETEQIIDRKFTKEQHCHNGVAPQQNNPDIDKLIYTVKALGNALIKANNNNGNEATHELIDLILYLNGLDIINKLRHESNLLQYNE